MTFVSEIRKKTMRTQGRKQCRFYQSMDGEKQAQGALVAV